MSTQDDDDSDQFSDLLEGRKFGTKAKFGILANLKLHYISATLIPIFDRFKSGDFFKTANQLIFIPPSYTTREKSFKEKQ